ncbi:MAG: hypothetical protein AAF581_05700 [Planctomycetota bacterium]
MKTTALIAIAAALLVGCSSGPIRPHGFDDTPAPRRDRVLLLQSDLRSQIRVDDIVAEWTPDGRLVAKLKIQNHADAPLHLMLKTVFLDRNGNRVEGAAVWEHVLLANGATHPHQLEALSRDAYDFTVQIRSEDS